MRVELGPGLFVEELPDGKLQFEATSLPAVVQLTREQLARALTRACNECLDPGD